MDDAPVLPVARPRSVRSVPWPVWPIATAIVIGVAASLVAVMLLMGVALINQAARPIQSRFQEMQNTFRKITFPQASTIYAADGSVLTSYGVNRTYVKLNKISITAQDATLAIEDHSFYQHGAIDLVAIFRAGLANLKSGTIVQGGSTITQQLVKNSEIGSTQETFSRKIEEAALAMKVEQVYSKGQILEMYMNEIYYGSGQYGIGTAAQFYFNEPANKLNISQSALLAGIPQSPTYFDPIRHPHLALQRRAEVLDAMYKYGYITQPQEQKALKSPLGLHVAKAQTSTTPPFFAYWVQQQMLDLNNHQYDKVLGTTYQQRQTTLFTGGLKIYTTYDPKWQQIAQNVADRRVTQPGLDTGIATVDNQTGAVKVLLSGKNYAKDQLDLVATMQNKRGVYIGVRQPGSSMKPYTLVAAFQQGIPPTTTYATNSPMYLPGWPSPGHLVSNAEPGSFGTVNLWTATADSINVVFAQLILRIKGEGATVAAVAKKMGITSPLDPVPSITLGSSSISPLDQASGYSTLANGGVHCTPYGVQKIVNPNGQKVFTAKPDCKQVITPDIAHLVTAMLEGVITGGTGTAANIGRPAAGKTGTTQNYADAWFAGFVPQYTTAVWVGNPRGEIGVSDFQGLGPMFGGTAAAPIWHDYMLGILQQGHIPPQGFAAAGHIQAKTTKVPNVVGKQQAQAETILTSANFTPSVSKVPSTQPAGTVVDQSPPGGSKATIGSTVTIDVSNGKTPPSPKPITVTVPGVVGYTQAAAMSALKGQGFAVSITYVTVSSKGQNGIVVGQTPHGGAKAAQGSTVVIQVGKYSKPSPSPSPSPS